jgi:hypothetical protein
MLTITIEKTDDPKYPYEVTYSDGENEVTLEVTTTHGILSALVEAEDAVLDEPFPPDVNIKEKWHEDLFRIMTNAGFSGADFEEPL